MEVVIASSSVADAGIGCWDLHTGAEQLRLKSCSSTARGLTSVGHRLVASSQLRDPSATSGSVFYWSWDRPQVEVKSFPAEPILPLAANSEGTYIAGGGVSGEIYLWEVPTGKLLRKWHAHYRAITCLVFSDDDSLVISGSEDGSVRVWSLFMIFDDMRRQEATHLYEHSFTGHALRITDVVIGYGGSNAIIVSASEDRTCKVWSLSKGILLRNIVFPSMIYAIALDPGEHVFYAGSRDGKIYVAALNAESSSNDAYGMYIIGSLADHSKVVTCLTYSNSLNLLVSGSEDGMVRVLDPKSGNVVRMFRHSKGPINNVQIVRKQLGFNPRMVVNPQGSSRRHGSLLPPPLEKYTNSSDDDSDFRTVVSLHGTSYEPLESPHISSNAMNQQIEELQRQSSSYATEMELERLKVDSKRSMQMVEKWKQMYENLHQFCVDELLDIDQVQPTKAGFT
ncbi:protein ROOT INITIATION DEFECTIVE 3 [Eucalyptus grandis]|uniref:protein ROOT INITIATION DEFECTIVE 3 n=1 Tax=Eucalyptus grandis TaxID=71139 RepID=UPI00192ED853|nr:protein ROOT INITIATION DEFECTIVE 3 [Eucalyptus grandis]